MDAEAVEELWTTVCATHAKHVEEWWQDCFKGREDEKQRKAKDEITETLNNAKWQADRRKNFLLRLISDDERAYETIHCVRVPRVRLALAFVRAMSGKPVWKDLLTTTLATVGDEMREQMRVKEAAVAAVSGDVLQRVPSDVRIRRRGNGLLHEAAKNGRCQDLQSYLAEANVNAVNGVGETPLHLAAEFEHVSDVQTLLNAGATVKPDRRGCTALHSAAMAIHPDYQTARSLMAFLRQSDRLTETLDRQSDAVYGSNTALHIAAGNINVTSEFIAEFSDANPRLQNSEGDTPFHVAAKSSNPSAVLFMLNTFAPSDTGWDVDDADQKRHYNAPTLLEICATEGNAEAVALLIHHGADISKGVLHELVIQSVKCTPSAVDGLVQVYDTIVHNAVTWRCLEENKKCLVKGSPLYNELLRETMIWLLTNPTLKYNKDVIQCAIEHGASAMLQAILNTPQVFTWRSHHVHMHDVTNFTESTKRDRRIVVNIPRDPDDRTFTKSFQPDVPYVSDIMVHFDEWQDSNILDSRPIRELSQPYVCVVKLCYFMLGLAQLLFMLAFSVSYLPSTCSLALMFNFTRIVSYCTNDNHTIVTPSEMRSTLPSGLWLVWPTLLNAIMLAAILCHFYWIFDVQLTKHCPECISFRQRSSTIGKRATKILLVFWQILPGIAFCVCVYIWFSVSHTSDSFVLYVHVTSMVFLFGWTANLIFFSGISKRFYVFALVLKEIVIKDIVLSFMLVFLFTVIGFSFALHTLRLEILPTGDGYEIQKSLFDVLTGGLGIGDYLVAIVDERLKVDKKLGLLEVVFLLYLCFAVLILMSILVAMMAHRFDRAKRYAVNLWRFQMLLIGLALERFACFRFIIRQLLRSDPSSNPLLCVCGCCWYSRRTVRAAADSHNYAGYVLEIVDAADIDDN